MRELSSLELGLFYWTCKSNFFSLSKLVELRPIGFLIGEKLLRFMVDDELRGASPLEKGKLGKSPLLSLKVLTTSC